jgi:pimeloyl-ACP methyl ester carboxylesterase
MNFHDLDAIAARNPALVARFRFSELTAVLVSGERSWTLTVDNGEVRVVDGPSPHADFTLTAAATDWESFASERPPVGFQTLYAMATVDRLKLSGPRMIEFVRHQMGFEMLVQGLRPTSVQKPRAMVAAPEIEPIVGRYIRLNIGGAQHRIYFEEAGQGIPLLCLHTAGADARQYRALFNDPAITDRFRVIAFDLPQHGKSSPPDGFQNGVHVLTTDSYVDTIMSFKAALGLEQPVVMGCSIGGRVVLHLALRHGGEFRAAIGLQSATHAENRTFPELADQNPLARPDMNAPDIAASSVWSLMAPNTPAHERWETLWYYMQGGPGVFTGDLFYYFADGDLRNGLVEPLRDRRCPVYLLSGEYDLSATPQMGAELAREIKAEHFQVMPGLGHFPMSEDPETFQTYLLPILGRIVGHEPSTRSPGA